MGKNIGLYSLLAPVLLVHGEQQPSLGVLGLGSNVVDRFFRVRGADGLGAALNQKGYFASEGEVVGGVTLNHLSWAAALGVPAALAALQGGDEAGRAIRAAMADHGVSADALTVSDEVSSSISQIILDEAGERTILMAPHATSTLGASRVKELFGAAVARASFVTTEVSQVPLDGVTAYLELAASHGVPSVLDIDVPPSVAAAAAALCATPADVLACARLASVLKVTRPSAVELLELAGISAAEIPEAPEELAASLQRVTGVALVAVTAGSAGGAMASASGVRVALAPAAASAIVDTTGAGDAFLGGLLAALWRLGAACGAAPLPDDVPALTACLAVANAAGAACCEVLGGLPPLDSARGRVVELMGELADGSAAVEHLPPPHDAPARRGAAPSPPAVSLSDNPVSRSLAADAATAAALAADAALCDAIGSAAAAIERSRAQGGLCLVTGLGKSGAVGSRLAASLASTGCRAHFVHAAEWAHGDLGNMPAENSAERATLIALTHSGKTAEVVGACREARARGLDVVLIGSSGAMDSPAGAVATHVLGYELPVGIIEPYGGAPTCSIVAQEAVGNALVIALADAARFDAARFRRNHPGGGEHVHVPDRPVHAVCMCMGDHPGGGEHVHVLCPPFSPPSHPRAFCRSMCMRTCTCMRLTPQGILRVSLPAPAQHSARACAR